MARVASSIKERGLKPDPAAPTRIDDYVAEEELPEGMTEWEVLNLLGPPDEVVLPDGPREPCKEPPMNPGERLLRYGTAGRGSLATLGAVVINTRGRATLVYGGKGQPPDARLAPTRLAWIPPVVRMTCIARGWSF